MEDLSLKARLLMQLKEQHENTVVKLKSVIDDTQKSANEYGAQKDRYDSYRMKLLRKKDMYTQQLVKLLEQTEVLDKIAIEKPYNKVEFGALVITQKQKIFISIGIGKLELDGDLYFAISPNVPIFKAMQGLSAGDTFNFRDEKIKILSIY